MDLMLEKKLRLSNVASAIILFYQNIPAVSQAASSMGATQTKGADLRHGK